MSELSAAAAAALGVPEAIVMRSAAARAAETGMTVDEVLGAWAGGGTVAGPAPAPEAEPAEAQEAATPSVGRNAGRSRNGAGGQPPGCSRASGLDSPCRHHTRPRARRGDACAGRRPRRGGDRAHGRDPGADQLRAPTMAGMGDAGHPPVRPVRPGWRRHRNLRRSQRAPNRRDQRRDRQLRWLRVHRLGNRWGQHRLRCPW